MRRHTLLWLFLGLLAVSYAPAVPARETVTPTLSLINTATPVLTATASPIPSPAPTGTRIPTPQPRLTPLPSGPDIENFSPGVDPLTGRAVSDASLLKIPAMLVSISNSPVTARPQAGPAFADWIFELFIGTGTTRFLGIFHGEYPHPVPNLPGDCDVEPLPLQSQAAWVGNRVWLDENQNGKQDPWEAGVGGICVSLYADGDHDNQMVTRTNSNGYFAFNLPTDTTGKQLGIKSFELSFNLPLDAPSPAYRFTTPNVGNDDEDSDANPLNGFTQPFTIHETDSSWDAGLQLINPPASGEGRVQPIRSGRLTYATINKMFPFSCLAFAGAGQGILERLDACRIVYGTDADDVNDGVLTSSEMRSLAEGNLTFRPINYSGHLFNSAPPPGGLAAEKLSVYYHAFNQAEWRYDPVSQTYLRWTDFQDGSGQLTPALDALTERQLAFENVVVIYAHHNIFRHLQYDINLRPGQEGYAFLFRDGQMYKIRWSTGNRAWEQKTGLIRPIHFIGTDKQPFPFKPGRTFIHIMTEFSAVEELKNGNWRAFFVVPNDPAPTPEK